MVFTAYIVDCVRTAGGKRNGLLSKWHPADLGATVVNALVDRSNLPPSSIDDVIFGCVSQVGAQGGNISRAVVLSSNLPESVPGVSVDRQCGSSLQALHFAAQAVMSGTQDIIIAGGVEVMSLVPIGASIQDGIQAGHGFPVGERMQERYPGVAFSQFAGAELVAKKSNVSKDDMDNFAIDSHRKAHIATQAGYFANEIIPIKGFDKKKDAEVTVTKDEGIRYPTNEKKLKSLKTLSSDGRITAATASQITDGASAVLICNELALKKYNLKPRAKIVAMSVVGHDPVMMLYGPVPATQKVLKRANMSVDDIDLFEVNEAFASVPLAVVKDLKVPIEKVNVNGGAIALGHPLGATGTKLTTTLVNELERQNKKFGLLAICEGYGTANATIIELCDHNIMDTNSSNSELRSKL